MTNLVITDFCDFISKVIIKEDGNLEGSAINEQLSGRNNEEERKKEEN